jgi:site-specific recombinase XerD
VRNARSRERESLQQHAHAMPVYVSGIGAATDLRTIQVFLGHGSIRSTSIYTRVSPERIARTRSPLDRLLETG